MSESKHTPGPWYHTYDIHEGRHWVSQQPQGGTFWTAEILTGCMGDETEANAHLIAAAPDLLEALEFALQQTGCDGDLCTEDWHEEARKAIAKAKGEK